VGGDKSKPITLKMFVLSSFFVMRILVTGASGGVGHYISETFINNTDHELFLMMRNPAKFQLDPQVRAGVTIVTADMLKIGDQAALLQTIDVAILTAAGWGGQEAYDVNYTKTHELLNLLNPQVCQQVIYFSTASILDSHNQLLPAAGQIGTDYIKSKHQCFSTLGELAVADRITTVFPTLVLGGDENKPYSFLSADLPLVTKYAGLLRWIKAEGSFHFIHGQDIAEIVRYLVEHPEVSEQYDRKVVMGNQLVIIEEGIREMCAYLGKPAIFQFPLSIALVNLVIKVFKIQMSEWDYFCLQNRYFENSPIVNPATFGLPIYAATLSDVLSTRGIKKI
jgi:nucleoside-diphosphate-sugar epimerase